MLGHFTTTDSIKLLLSFSLLYFSYGVLGGVGSVELLVYLSGKRDNYQRKQ